MLNTVTNKSIKHKTPNSYFQKQILYYIMKWA